MGEVEGEERRNAFTSMIPNMLELRPVIGVVPLLCGNPTERLVT